MTVSPHQRFGLWRSALAVVALFIATSAAAQEPWESEIVFEGDGGVLVYVSDAEGNRVPDFSHAGYRGGGVDLPHIPTVLTLAPAEGDDTERIQAAIDEVSARAPDGSGFRGAVELEPGIYDVERVDIRASGVVLRGAGDGEDPATNTILRRTGTSRAPIVFLGRSEFSDDNEALIRRDASRDTTRILDDVVPIGATTFRVNTPRLYAAGDSIVIYHPATEAWLAAIDGGGTAADPPWEVGEVPIAYVRTITEASGRRITVDAPLFSTLDRSLSESYIYLRDRTGVIEEVGLESLRIDIETDGPTSEGHSRTAVRFRLVENAWTTDVTALHFWHAGIAVEQARHVTVRDCQALEPHSEIIGERRYNFEAFRAQDVLFEGNYATEARHAYVTNGEALDSGVVFLDNVSEDAYESSEAHRRWGLGILYDNHTEIGSSGASWLSRRLHLGNRGSYGTAHGWSCANCVAWNAEMNGSPLVVEKPPTAQNYAIGTQGEAQDSGPFFSDTGAYIEGNDRPGLTPRSLYLRQLSDRLTPVAAEPPPDAAAPEARLLPPTPNPTRGEANIGFELPEPAEVRLGLYDALGREVARLAEGRYAAGRHDADLGGRDLAPGVYLYRLSVTAGDGAHVFTRPLVRLR